MRHGGSARSSWTSWSPAACSSTVACQACLRPQRGVRGRRRALRPLHHAHGRARTTPTLVRFPPVLNRKHFETQRLPQEHAAARGHASTASSATRKTHVALIQDARGGQRLERPSEDDRRRADARRLLPALPHAQGRPAPPTGARSTCSRTASATSRRPTRRACRCSACASSCASARPTDVHELALRLARARPRR